VRINNDTEENVLTPVEEELKTLTVDDAEADQGLEKEDMDPEPCIMAFCCSYT